MDIHKPKPWRGWREFLKEYAIIVVGVLTALGAEQAVEWLHWRHVAAQTEESLKAGVRYDLAAAMVRVASYPCVHDRIVELTRALAADAPQWRSAAIPLPPGEPDRGFPNVVEERKQLYAQTPWDIATAQGALTHLPPAEVTLFAGAYRGAGKIEEFGARESELQGRLGPLAFDGPLSRDERLGFLSVLSQLAVDERNLLAFNRNLLRAAKDLGLTPPRQAYEAVAKARAERGACVRDVSFPVT